MADIQVLRKTPVTVTQTFAVDGTPLDLDSGVPTVVVTAPDGTTTTYNAGTTPAVQGSWTGRTTGQYRLVLAAQPEVTWRDLAWTGTIGGEPLTLPSRVEWLGDLLFTLAGFRALKVAGGSPFASTSNYPDAQVLETRAEVLDEFSDILGFSPVPRFYRETISIPYGGVVVLSEKFPTRILTLTAGGVAQTPANYFIADGGRLLPVTNYLASPWGAYGYGAVVVEYVAGWPRVKGDLTDVAMLRAAMKLDPAISPMASTVTTADGASYSFDAAGQVTQGGTIRHFGVPPIDSWLQRHSMLERMPGVA